MKPTQEGATETGAEPVQKVEEAAKKDDASVSIMEHTKKIAGLENELEPKVP